MDMAEGPADMTALQEIEKQQHEDTETYGSAEGEEIHPRHKEMPEFEQTGENLVLCSDVDSEKSSARDEEISGTTDDHSVSSNTSVGARKKRNRRNRKKRSNANYQSDSQSTTPRENPVASIISSELHMESLLYNNCDEMDSSRQLDTGEIEFTSNEWRNPGGVGGNETEAKEITILHAASDTDDYCASNTDFTNHVFEASETDFASYHCIHAVEQTSDLTSDLPETHKMDEDEDIYNSNTLPQLYNPEESAGDVSDIQTNDEQEPEETDNFGIVEGEELPSGYYEVEDDANNPDFTTSDFDPQETDLMSHDYINAFPEQAAEDNHVSDSDLTNDLQEATKEDDFNLNIEQQPNTEMNEPEEHVDLSENDDFQYEDIDDIGVSADEEIHSEYYKETTELDQGVDNPAMWSDVESDKSSAQYEEDVSGIETTDHDDDKSVVSISSTGSLKKQNRKQQSHDNLKSECKESLATTPREQAVEELTMSTAEKVESTEHLDFSSSLKTEEISDSANTKKTEVAGSEPKAAVETEAADISNDLISAADVTALECVGALEEFYVVADEFLLGVEGSEATGIQQTTNESAEAVTISVTKEDDLQTAAIEQAVEDEVCMSTTAVEVAETVAIVETDVENEREEAMSSIENSEVIVTKSSIAAEDAEATDNDVEQPSEDEAAFESKSITANEDTALEARLELTKADAGFEQTGEVAAYKQTAKDGDIDFESISTTAGDYIEVETEEAMDSVENSEGLSNEPSIAAEDAQATDNDVELPSEDEAAFESKTITAEEDRTLDPAIDEAVKVSAIEQIVESSAYEQTEEILTFEQSVGYTDDVKSSANEPDQGEVGRAEFEQQITRDAEFDQTLEVQELQQTAEVKGTITTVESGEFQLTTEEDADVAAFKSISESVIDSGEVVTEDTIDSINTEQSLAIEPSIGVGDTEDYYTEQASKDAAAYNSMSVTADEDNEIAHLEHSAAEAEGFHLTSNAAVADEDSRALALDQAIVSTEFIPSGNENEEPEAIECEPPQEDEASKYTVGDAELQSAITNSNEDAEVAVFEHSVEVPAFEQAIKDAEFGQTVDDTEAESVSETAQENAETAAIEQAIEDEALVSTSEENDDAESVTIEHAAEDIVADESVSTTAEGYEEIETVEEISSIESIAINESSFGVENKEATENTDHEQESEEVAGNELMSTAAEEDNDIAMFEQTEQVGAFEQTVDYTEFESSTNANDAEVEECEQTLEEALEHIVEDTEFPTITITEGDYEEIISGQAMTDSLENTHGLVSESSIVDEDSEAAYNVQTSKEEEAAYETMSETADEEVEFVPIEKKTKNNANVQSILTMLAEEIHAEVFGNTADYTEPMSSANVIAEVEVAKCKHTVVDKLKETVKPAACEETVDNSEVQSISLTAADQENAVGALDYSTETEYQSFSTTADEDAEVTGLEQTTDDAEFHSFSTTGDDDAYIRALEQTIEDAECKTVETEAFDQAVNAANLVSSGNTDEETENVDSTPKLDNEAFERILDALQFRYSAIADEDTEASALKQTEEIVDYGSISSTAGEDAGEESIKLMTVVTSAEETEDVEDVDFNNNLTIVEKNDMAATESKSKIANEDFGDASKKLTLNADTHEKSEVAAIKQTIGDETCKYTIRDENLQSAFTASGKNAKVVEFESVDEDTGEDSIDSRSTTSSVGEIIRLLVAEKNNKSAAIKSKHKTSVGEKTGDASIKLTSNATRDEIEVATNDLMKPIENQIQVTAINAEFEDHETQLFDEAALKRSDPWLRNRDIDASYLARTQPLRPDTPRKTEREVRRSRYEVSSKKEVQPREGRPKTPKSLEAHHQKYQSRPGRPKPLKAEHKTSPIESSNGPPTMTESDIDFLDENIAVSDSDDEIAQNNTFGFLCCMGKRSKSLSKKKSHGSSRGGNRGRSPSITSRIACAARKTFANK